jgi:predicted permease
VSALSALLSSLVPAWRATRADLVTTLKAPTSAGVRLRLWGRNTLVCGQIALSLVLLTVTVSLYRGFQAEIGQGPGFRTDHVLMMTFDPDLAGYDGPRSDAFYQRLKERAATIAGVRSVTLTSSPHMDQYNIEQTAIVPEGFTFPPGTESVTVRSARVDEDYFETTATPIIGGRGLRPTDTSGAPAVAVVNSTFAARYWPGLDAIGRRFRMGTSDGAWVQVVGVAADAKYSASSWVPREFIYYSRLQNPGAQTSLISTLLVHTDIDAASVSAPLRSVVRAIEPNMPLFGIHTIEDFYGSAVTLSHVTVETVGTMGGLALLIAVAGLYGLVAYSVSRRTREIGLRMAIGADSGSVLRMVLRQGFLLAAVGSLLGIAGSVLMSDVIRAAFPLRGVSGVDLATYLVVVPSLLAVTLLAAYVPARRAAHIDPLAALRQD